MKRLFPVFLVALLGAVVVRYATIEIEWLLVRWWIVAYFLFGIVGFTWQAYRRNDTVIRFGLAAIAYALPGLFLSWAVVVQSRTQLPETGRVLTFGLVFVAFLVFVGASAETVSFLRRSGAYLVAFAVMLFAIFSHLPALPPGSGGISYAMQAGLLMGLNLFVLPRYVSRGAFLWTVAVVSGVVMAASLPVYVLGEYAVFGQPVRLWGTTSALPLLGVELPFFQSIFGNPNGTGVLAFAGTVCAVTVAHRAFLDATWAPSGTRVSPLAVLGGLLAVVNGLALLVSFSRTSWLAAAVALGIYVAAVALGRDRLPHAVLAAGGAVAVFLLVVFLSVLGVNTNGRFVLWGGGLRAVLDAASPLGGGMVSSSEVIAPYIEGQYEGFSVHNSYLFMFMRAGLLGGVAYLALTIGSVIDAAARRFDAEVPFVALAAGFAVHQLFESYTLYQFGIGSVLGALAVGYLIVDAPPKVGNRDWVADLGSRSRGVLDAVRSDRADGDGLTR